MPINELDIEAAVNERYAGASSACETELCCPVSYDTRLLAPIPAEVIERDYGCGDPSRYAREGDTVLDLGSGGGKMCFMLSQVVGPTGNVIGVDMNDEMLKLARDSQNQVAGAIGHGNIRFNKGRIQDLALDIDQLDEWLANNPVHNASDLDATHKHMSHLRSTTPMVPDNAVDLVVSNCVLNLVRDEDKLALIKEVFRVLKKGGRIAISDIVCDEIPSAEMKADPKMWSGCISGAFGETEFLDVLSDAGFHGIEISEWSDEPWQTVNGIEFRAVVVTAHKGKQGPCMEAKQAVIYKGPWSQVADDDGHVFRRGVRTAVCAKTHALLTQPPYTDQMIGIQPRVGIPEDDRKPFDLGSQVTRHPRETKGMDYDSTITATGDCGTTECC